MATENMGADQTGEPPSPVNALRNFYGDRKLPDISRKITACVACRKQKIKCRMRNSNPPCLRCQERGLPCTVNRSLQMILENDVLWKRDMENKIQHLQTLVSNLVKETASSELTLQRSHKLSETDMPEFSEIDEQNCETQTSSTNNIARPGGVIINLGSCPGDAPGFQIIQTPSDIHAYDTQDLISRGVVSVENAQRYLEIYQHRLDHFLYGILGDLGNASLHRVRQTSSLLTASICTVGSLHLSSNDFDACYRAFLSLARSRSFSNDTNPDDVRGLIIGAFWLDEISRSLIASAVRIAVEHQMHKSFFQAIRGDKTQYLYARLYFLVYVCDRHHSIIFGRPLITRECSAIRRVRELLDCEHSAADDARLASQVLRWSLCSEIFDTFGDGNGQPLSGIEISKFRRFNITIENLRAEWMDKFGPNANIGNYPRKGVGLQSLFVKLYLCSRAFRSIGAEQTCSMADFDITMELHEATNSAVMAAMSILQSVVSDAEIQSFLNGLPTYFHTMIAFAAVFLLKVSLTPSTTFGFTLHFSDVRQLLKSLVSTLKDVTSTMHERHLLVRITNGLASVFYGIGDTQALMAILNAESLQNGAMSSLDGSALWSSNSNWADIGLFDASFVGEYCFQ